MAFIQITPSNEEGHCSLGVAIDIAREAMEQASLVVGEKYQGLGIGTYLYNMLIRLAKKRGLKGFTAEVLDTNRGMIKVFEKGDLLMNARGVYQLTIPFDDRPSQPKSDPI